MLGQTLRDTIGKDLTPEEFAELFFDFKCFPYQKKTINTQSKRVHVDAGRQTGKSTLVAARAIYEALMKRDQTILIVSPTQRQSGILFRRIKALLSHSAFKFPELRLSDFIVRETQTVIEFSTGGAVYSLPASDNGDNLRGFTANVIFVDEAAQVPISLFPAITPMLATTNGSMWLTGTPKGVNNYFFEAWKNPKLGYELHHFKSENNPLIPAEFLEAEKERMPLNEYLEEYEGEFIDETDSFFPLKLIENCLVNVERTSPTRYARYYLGVDPARFGQDSAVFCILEEIADKLTAVAFIEVNENSTLELCAHIQRLHSMWKFKKIMVDTTGMGAGVTDFLKQYKLPVEELVLTIKTKEDMYNNLKVYMESGELGITNSRKLKKQMNELKAEWDKSMQHLKIFNPRKKAHDDYPTALALAVYCLNRNSGEVFFYKSRGVFSDL